MHLVMRYLCFFGIVKRQGVKRRMDKRNTSEEQKSGYLGLTRADEERHLADVISVAQQNLERAGADIRKVNEDLADLLETYDVKDKEGLALWNNATARLKENEYDLIIVDSTDPFGPGEGLFTREFYGNCYKALKEDGIMVNQHESPFYAEDAEACKRAHKRIVESFPISRVYQAHIPTYPSGHWLFGFASKRFHPVADQHAEWWLAQGLKTKYYNQYVHSGCFALPNNVRDVLRETKPAT